MTDAELNQCPHCHERLTTTRELPKVGEPVDIVFLGGFTERHTVAIRDDLPVGFGVAALKFRICRWYPHEENKIPGWRRVTEQAAKIERRPRAGETVKCWPLTIDGRPADVGEWSRHKVEDVEDDSFRPVGMMRRWLAGKGKTWEFDDEPTERSYGKSEPWTHPLDEQPPHDPPDEYDDGPASEPAKPEPSEREREAQELAEIVAASEGLKTASWESRHPQSRRNWLRARDKAEAIFAAKAEGKLENARRAHDSTIRAWQKAEEELDAARAEVERSTARVDAYQRANTSLNEGLAYQQDENKRLAGQVDELTAQRDRAQALAASVAIEEHEMTAIVCEWWASGSPLAQHLAMRICQAQIAKAGARIDSGPTEAALAAAEAKCG